MNFKEWSLVQWFYRWFICPYKNHNWKQWEALGLPAKPYCTRCGEYDETWETPADNNFVWRIKEEDSGKTTINS